MDRHIWDCICLINLNILNIHTYLTLHWIFSTSDYFGRVRDMYHLPQDPHNISYIYFLIRFYLFQYWSYIYFLSFHICWSHIVYLSHWFLLIFHNHNCPIFTNNSYAEDFRLVADSYFESRSFDKTIEHTYSSIMACQASTRFDSYTLKQRSRMNFYVLLIFLQCVQGLNSFWKMDY